LKERITVTIDKDVYKRLKEKGFFGETYSQLISRLIDLVETTIYDGGKLKVV